MWPFKRKPVLDFKDFIKTKEEPPCGNKEVHYYWTTSKFEAHACPKCYANIQKRKEDDNTNHLADLIARKVVDLLKEEDPINPSNQPPR